MTYYNKNILISVALKEAKEPIKASVMEVFPGETGVTVTFRGLCHL